MSRQFSRIVRSCVIASVIGLAALQTASAGLLAFYDFEGNAQDRSGNARHGTVGGPVLSASGYEGMGYQFDGVDDYISIPVDINPSVVPRLTMGAWVRPTIATGIRGILSHDSGGYDRNLNIDIRGGGWRYSAFTGSGVVGTGTPPAVGAWMFVAVRYDDIADSLTLDVGTSRLTVTANPQSGYTFTRIGSNPGFSEYFAGTIDNVSLYNEVLSDQRIDQIRRDGTSAIRPPPAVPEPGMLSLAGVALVCGVCWRRRARRIVKLRDNAEFPQLANNADRSSAVSL
jgi:hypothetical protein